MAPSWDSGAPLRLYLLGWLLLTGVEPQSNYTEPMFNLTGLSHTTVVNGNTSNVTSLDSELNRIGVEHNLTVITEDEEEFQDWENELRPEQCHEALLSELSRGYCAEEFYMKMTDVDPEKWCHLKEVIRPYHEMTQCLEMLSTAVGCFYPKPIIQDLFLEIHAHFFKTCSRADLEGDQGFVDPPQAVVLTLTLLPVSLIPALVYMAIRKNQAHK